MKLNFYSVLKKIIFSFTVFSSFFGYSEELKVSFFNIPPFMIVEDNNTKVTGGILVALTKKVLDKAGIEYKITAFPAPRLYKNLMTGETHLWTGIHTTGIYNDYVEMGSEILMDLELRIYSKSGVIPPRSLDDLKGQSILILRGFTYGGKIHFLKDPENKILVDESKDHENAMLKLYHGRQPYLLNYKEPVNQALKKINLTADSFNYSILEKIPIYFIISKKVPNAKKILHLLEEVLKKIRDNK